MSSWYAIEARADRASVYLYDEIGKKGVTAKAFAAEFNAITASHIDLYVESLGGSVIEGTAIKSTIQRHPAHVTAHIDSIAGSITSDIILACDEICIADDAYVMIHNPSLESNGDADEHRKSAEVLDKMTAAMAEAYASRMRITADEARALMKAETWYCGQEAVDAGYADKTYSGRAMVAHFDPERFTAKAPKAAIERFTKSPPRGKSQPSAKKGNPMSDETSATLTDETSNSPEAPAAVEPEASDTMEAPVETEPTASAENVEAAVRKALAEDRKRAASITALGDKFGFVTDAKDYVAAGKSLEEFRAHVLGKSPDDWKASLAVRNPPQQDLGDEAESKEASDAVAKIKERRKAAR